MKIDEIMAKVDEVDERINLIKGKKNILQGYSLKSTETLKKTGS